MQLETMYSQHDRRVATIVLNRPHVLRSRHPTWRLVSAFLGVPLIPVLPPPLFRGKPRQHDDDPHEPEQREKRDASRTPIDGAKNIQAQADQTGSAEDTMNTSVNSHA